MQPISFTDLTNWLRSTFIPDEFNRVTHHCDDRID